MGRASGAEVALIPAVVALAAIPVLGEWPAAAEAVALACVVGGVLLSARRPPSISTTTAARPTP